jgi:hypothetical protein
VIATDPNRILLAGDAAEAREAAFAIVLPVELSHLYDALLEIDGDAFECGFDPGDQYFYVEWAEGWSARRLAAAITALYETKGDS